ncbi:MAG: hypothetical protein NW204_09120 [Xanthomonadaceae bacterium]|nr:hypothetical protein [Xanthomonadaceae bacterium]
MANTGAKAVQVASLGRLHLARYTSYLPGEADARALPDAHFVATHGADAVDVQWPGAAPADHHFASVVAKHLLGLRNSLNQEMPFAIDSLRLRVILIPDGFRYAKTANRVFSGNHVSAEFAVRAGSHREQSMRLAVRDVAHELMHAIFSINGISSKAKEADGGSLEEEAIYTTENCIELRVIGSTAGDPLSSQSRRFDASRLGPTSATTSLVSGQRVDTALGGLFAPGSPPITADDPRAETLHSLCRQAIARLMAGARSRVE